MDRSDQYIKFCEIISMCLHLRVLLTRNYKRKVGDRVGFLFFFCGVCVSQIV